MKRIVLLFVALILVSPIIAVTMTIKMDVKQSAVIISLNNKEYKNGDFLPAAVNIDSVKISEVSKLDHAMPHRLFVDKIEIKFGRGTCNFKDENKVWAYKIAPFTTQPNNLIKVDRGDGSDEYTFKVELTEKEITENLSFVIDDSLKNISLDENTQKSIVIGINNDQDYPIENLVVKCGERKIECNEKNDKLHFKISYDDIEADSSTVVVVYDIKGFPALKNMKRQLLVVHKNGKAKDSIYLAYFLIPILLFTIFLIWHIRKRRKWRYEAKKFTAIDNKVFSILCSDIPTIGDEGNKIGKFETYDG